MGIYAGAASNKTQPLSLSYVDAAQQINQYCGPNFVNGTIPGVGASGSAQSGASAMSIQIRGQWMVPWAATLATLLTVGW